MFTVWFGIRSPPRAVRGLSDVDASAFDYGALDPHEDLDFGPGFFLKSVTPKGGLWIRPGEIFLNVF